MMTEIELFVFEINLAHDLISLEKNQNVWIIKISPCNNWNLVKTFNFHETSEVYEELLIEEDEKVEYPLPIIGFDSFRLKKDFWHFCLNASEVEWGFVSKWPEKV